MVVSTSFGRIWLTKPCSQSVIRIIVEVRVGEVGTERAPFAAAARVGRERGEEVDLPRRRGSAEAVGALVERDRVVGDGVG